MYAYIFIRRSTNDGHMNLRRMYAKNDPANVVAVEYNNVMGEMCTAL